jgi:hypothetical protein
MSLVNITLGQTGVFGIVLAPYLLIVSKESRFHNSQRLFNVCRRWIDDVGGLDNVVVVRVV